MRIFHIEPWTGVEGPGNRFCLWVQGCRRHCPGCFNPQTWEFNSGEEISADELLSQIFETRDIEGITLLGGEPFEQAEELYRVCKTVREKGLSVVAFTGYTLEELQQTDDQNVHMLLSEVDLLIDGPFLIEQQDFSRPWVGSKNQRYLFMTDRYSVQDVFNSDQKVEFHIDKQGKIHINGMPNLEMQAFLGII